ncbi:MAG: DUF5906 domain-containing protein [Succinivibrio sp.]
MNNHRLQERTFSLLSLPEIVEDCLKKVGLLLLKLSADKGSNEELTNAVGAFIWKLERLNVKHSLNFVLDLIGNDLSDVQKEEVSSIYNALCGKITAESLPSDFYNFLKSSLAEDKCTITTKIIKINFISFLSDYFKVKYVNDVLSYWNRIEYVQGKSQLIALIHNIKLFFEVENFQSESTFVDEYMAEQLIRSCTYIDNYRLPLQNYDLIIDENDPSLNKLKLANKSSSNYVTCALKISILEDEKLNLMDTDQVSQSIYKWLEQKEQYSKFQKFITDMFEGDTAKKDRLGEILGSVFLRDNKIKSKAVAFLVGPKSTGKSSILNIFTKVIGSENCCSINPNILGGQFSLQSAIGKRANFVHEAPSSNLDQNCIAKFRNIVSNDPVYIDTKYGDPSMHRLYMKNIFACNNLPFIKWDAGYNGVDAFLYRIQIFPITKQFKESDLSRKFEHDKEFCNAMFVFALKGALRLLKNGEYTHCRDCELAMKEYKKDISALYEYVSSVCDKNSLTDIPKDKVFENVWELEKYTIEGAYKKFKDWAKGEGYFPKGDYPTKKMFCSTVTDIYEDIEVKRGSLWIHNGVTKERTQRNIFALKGDDKEKKNERQ